MSEENTPLEVNPEECEDTEDFVEIHSFGSELNAISIKAALNSIGIDVILRKISTSMFPAPFDTVRLAVRVSDIQKAREIITEILNDQSAAITPEKGEAKSEEEKAE